MFKNKEPKFVVEFQIDFNVTNAATWLEEGGDLDTLGRKEANWYKREDEEFGLADPIINSYIVDILPLKGVDAYYHRRANRMANNICGIDFLNNVTDRRLLDFCEKHKISVFQWDFWRSKYLIGSINQRPAIIVPIDKFLELQIHGKLLPESVVGNRLDREYVKMEVPSSYNEDGTVKSHVSIWTGTASRESVGYKNEIVTVSANTLNFEVEY